MTSFFACGFVPLRFLTQNNAFTFATNKEYVKENKKIIPMLDNEKWIKTTAIRKVFFHCLYLHWNFRSSFLFFKFNAQCKWWWIWNVFVCLFVCIFSQINFPGNSIPWVQLNGMAKIGISYSFLLGPHFGIVFDSESKTGLLNRVAICILHISFQF